MVSPPRDPCCLGSCLIVHTVGPTQPAKGALSDCVAVLSPAHSSTVSGAPFHKSELTGKEGKAMHISESGLFLNMTVDTRRGCTCTRGPCFPLYRVWLIVTWPDCVPALSERFTFHLHSLVSAIYSSLFKRLHACFCVLLGVFLRSVYPRYPGLSL